jgi:hypothetical protein
MRYQILGREQESGKSVEPFFVEAEDEQDARNRAAETGILVDRIILEPPQAPPAPQLPAIAHPGGRGLRSGGLIPGIMIGVVIGIVLVFLLQRRTGLSPDELFKAISDAKKAQVSQLLESKGSKLSNYKASFVEETDVERRMESPYVGVIEFSYTVTKPEGEFKSQMLYTASAEYRYARKQAKWVSQGCFLKQGGDVPEPKELLVNFPEVKAAFER